MKVNCNHCKYHHENDRIVCAVHPFGPAHSDCPDFVPESWKQRLRRRLKYPILVFGGFMFALITLSKIFLMSSIVWSAALVLLQILPTKERFQAVVPILAGMLATAFMLVTLFSLLREIRDYYFYGHTWHKYAIAKLSGSLVGVNIWLLAIKGIFDV
jgi:hypothetical protein